MASLAYTHAAGRPRAPARPADLGERLTIWAIWSLCLAGVVREILGQTLLFNFGFYSFHIVDPVVVLTFLACAVRHLHRSFVRRIYTIPILVIAVLVMMNLARGLMVETNLALLWARANVETAALLLLALYAELTPQILRAIRRAILASSLLIVGLLCLRLHFGPNLFMTYNLIDASMINDGGRPIGAEGAFFVGMGGAILWSGVFRRGVWNLTWETAFALLFTIAVLLSGQGTASMAALAMMGIVAVCEPGPVRRERVLAGSLLLLLVVVALSTNTLDTLASAKFGHWNAAHRLGDFKGRTLIWAELWRVFPSYPLLTQVFGFPAGQMPLLILFLSNRSVNWTMSIHSMYFGSLPMMGYVGAVAYIALMLILTVQALKSVVGRHAAPAYVLAFCVGTAIFSLSYEIRNDSLIGLFAVIWWVRYAAVAVSPRRMAQRPGRPMPVARPVSPSL